MVKRLCCVLGRVRSKSNTTWILWLSQLPSRLFISILSIFKNYVVSIGPPGGNGMPEEPFVCAIKSLSNLCTANELNHRTSIIPYSEFYLNDFVSRLNFKEEYKRWRKSLEDNSVTEFSLLNYPFLFDPVAKTRIMHIDAMVKMSLQYEEACVKQALVMHTQRFLDDSNAMKEMEEKMKRSVNPYLVLEIRRSHFVSDVLQQVKRFLKRI
jgi:ubiquitin-protein ligase E3 A